MLPEPLPAHLLNNVTFAKVLVDQHTGTKFGYCFGGDRPGPNALFATWSPVIDAVPHRLATLPTLPWMWGQLYLVALDRLKDDQRADVVRCMPDLTFDDATILADPEPEELEKNNLDASYWAVLRMCSGLGMIQGRGVTAQHD